MFSFLVWGQKSANSLWWFLKTKHGRLSACPAFAIDQCPQFAFLLVPATLCSARSASADFCTLIVCLNSSLICYEHQNLALRNPRGAKLLCSLVFCAGYRKAFAWFISEFRDVACHCQCQRSGPQEAWRCWGSTTRFVYACTSSGGCAKKPIRLLAFHAFGGDGMGPFVTQTQ